MSRENIYDLIATNYGVIYEDVVFLMSELESYLHLTKKVRRSKVILNQR